MSDLLNKYKEAHDRFIDELVKYYPLHESFLERQSPSRTSNLRKVFKQLRIAVRELEQIAQLRMKERRVEWGKHNRLKKEKKE